VGLAANSGSAVRRLMAGLRRGACWTAVWVAALLGLSCEADRPVGLPGDSAAPIDVGSGRSTLSTTTPSGAVVLVGAGDIAGSGDGDEQTAQLLDQVVAADGDAVTVFTAGDNVYSSGTLEQFNQYYAPTWGRHKDRTRPSPGNHDYGTSGAAGYFAYFGAIAGPQGLGYYSYDVGAWHVISLNSEVDMDAGSAQEQWLRDDLAATTKQCVLAYWHKPRFSSGSHGNSESTEPLWQALYDAEAEVVVAGHDHTYERFAPQDPGGTLDPSRGIREFVVGTGGRSLYSFGSPEANSEVRHNQSFGVLKLTLSPGAYAWEFLPVSGSFTDSGSGTCHGATPGPASAATTEITANPTSIVADGNATATITVQLRDANGVALTTGGDAVALMTSLGTLSVVTDLDNGTYTATLTGTAAGVATVTGTVNTEAIADNAAVTLRMVASGAMSTITASPTSIVADGSASATITVHLKDGSGDDLTTGGDAVVLMTSLGTLSAVTDLDDGTYTATLTAGPTPGTATVTGTVNEEPIATNATVNLTPAPASGATSTIVSSLTTIVADGSSTSTITVQLKDVNGVNLTAGGDVVTLATTLGSLLAVNDRGDGTYTSTLQAGTTPGIATITGWVRVAGADEAIVDDATVTFSSSIALTATLVKSRGLLKADLLWSGATGTSILVYRNTELVVTTENDGEHRDNIDERGSGTYQYQVCEAGLPGRCSDVVTAGDPGSNPLTASFAYACSGLSCDFMDSSSDTDGSILSWDWDFGDENGSTTQNPTHAYATAGTYMVTLTVVDDLGNMDIASQSVSVSVSPPPAGAPTVTMCSPAAAATGAQLTVQVLGTNFTDGAKADFGDRVTVRSVTVQGPTLLEAVIRVHPQATAGARDVTVTNPDGLSGTLPGCFTVN